LAAFGVVSLAAMAAAAALNVVGAGAFFERYFGGVDPALVVGAIAVVGVISLRAFQVCGWFGERPERGATGIGVAAALAMSFAILVVIVDRFAGIEVTNVPAPWSLLFYPSIALVVEVVFHMAPLALLVVSLRSIAPAYTDRAAWACILLVSLLEPI
jgi:hypothetical protein